MPVFSDIVLILGVWPLLLRWLRHNVRVGITTGFEDVAGGALEIRAGFILPATCSFFTVTLGVGSLSPISVAFLSVRLLEDDGGFGEV